ncbi:MAG TPA: hypothetical protein VHC69_32220 [Polyangiaceae bacterium]|nr:hypothetical protein [Polyangiaceae bacterium]
MGELFARMWREIAARPSGPMAFRFYLQPTMAILAAAHDGLRDAREGRPAYFWSLFVDREHRRARLREGWRAVRNIFALAAAMDVVYQVFVLRGFRPVQAVDVAVLLAILPYLFVRGPVNRVARRLRRLRAKKKAA